MPSQSVVVNTDGWKTMSLPDCIERVKAPSKIPKKQYLEEGTYPVISQEATQISGYWNNSEDVFSVDKPLVIFGDHTCNVKFVDFDFVVGADGVKILKPKEFLDGKFFFYQLLSFNLQSTGYARHFRKLKEYIIAIPPLEEQQRIVSILDETFQNIENSLHGAENNHEFTEDFFQSSLVEIFYDNVDNGSEFEIGKICMLWQGLAINKKTKHLLVNNSSLPLLRIKDLRNGTVEQYVSESGYPPNSAVGLEDVIYTRTGQVGLVFRGRKGILHNNCFKVVPNTDILSREYLFWWLQNPIFKKEIISLSSRAAQPDITHKIFKAQKITVPSLDYQKRAVLDIEERYSKSMKIGEILKNKIDNLHELKRSILQEAFNGTL